VVVGFGDPESETRARAQNADGAHLGLSPRDQPLPRTPRSAEQCPVTNFDADSRKASSIDDFLGLHAAMYPETVALASIMITVHWVAAAASPHESDRDRFYTEVARRLDLPTYRTDGLGEALATWAAHESRYALTELLQGPTTPKDANPHPL